MKKYMRQAVVGLLATTCAVAHADGQTISPQRSAGVAGTENVESVQQSDPDTNAVWRDSIVVAAAPPSSLWQTLITQTDEVTPWGKAAVSPGVTTNTNYAGVVYVVDVGVGRHVDLNVVEWVNPTDPVTTACGTRSGVGISPCTAAAYSKVVGCYTHATAVAGVIGAKANATGIMGVQPGARIVSVRARKSTASGCSALDPADVVAALTWVKNDIAQYNSSGRPSVVNLSMSWPAFDASIKAKIRELATPTSGFVGAFVTQSAGNDFDDACTYAYVDDNAHSASPSDGIMVVSAINNHGQPVVPLNGAPGFWKQVNDATGHIVHQTGSNFGSCVDAWAPGDAILTTMGEISSQSSTVTYDKYGFASGTSFAAPHVAGLAAYLIEHNVTATTPAAVEALVRSNLTLLGSQAPSSRAFNQFHTANGVPIKLPTLAPPPLPRNTPYAEFVLSRLCSYPVYETRPPTCTVYQAIDGITIPASGLVEQKPFNNATDLVLNGFAPNRHTLVRTTQNIWLSFDSYGSPAAEYTCDVAYYQGGAGPFTLFSGGQRYFQPDTAFGSDLKFVSNCTSAQVDSN